MNMMKKKLIFTILTLLGCFLTGVAADTAEETARQFLSRKFGAVPETAVVERTSLVGSKLVRASSRSGESDFYAYSGLMRGRDCFVLMANTANGLKVVGYGDDASFSFDEIPDAMREVLAQMKAAAERGTNSWDGEPCTPVAPLLTTKWGQGVPFNDACPTYNGGRLYTGCTPTAMAQILRYHHSPNPGLDKIEYVDEGVSGKEISVDFTKINYDWTKMIDVYEEGKYTSAQAEQVARLMADCGAACKAEYGFSGTSSPMAYVALNRYYNFNCEFWYRDWHSTDVWMKRVQEELLARRPILYGASTGSSAHTFVVDGIDADNNVHINWGWSGKADGYYDLTYCHPSTEDDGYDGAHTMLVGISPRQEGDAPYEETPVCVGYTGSYCGVNTCYLDADGVTANTYGPMEYYLGFCLVAGGKVKYQPAADDMPDVSRMCFPGYMSPGTYQKAVFEGNVADGDYELRLMWRKSADEPWRLMSMNEEGVAKVKYKDGKSSYTNPDKGVQGIDLLGIEPASDLIGKTDMWLRLTARRNVDGIYDWGGGDNRFQFSVNFVSVDDGKVYEGRTLYFNSPYADVIETKTFSMTPTNPDNGFRMPSGTYKVVPSEGVTCAKDLFITLKPEVDYPILTASQTARTRTSGRIWVEQHEQIRMYSEVWVANNRDGKVSANLYACPTDGGREVFLATVRDVQLVFKPNAPTGASIDWNQDFNYYPLEGGYVFKVRQLTPDGEREMLNPFVREYEYKIIPNAEMPKIVMMPETERMSPLYVAGQPQTVEVALRNESQTDLSGTVFATFIERSKGISFEVVSREISLPAGGQASAAFDVQFPESGNYDVYFRCFYNRTMVLDTDGGQAVKSLAVGEAGIGGPSASTLRLYPNPAADEAAVDGLAEGSLVAVYSLEGVKVAEVVAVGTSATLDLRALPAGVYLVHASGKVLKLAKQ